MPLVLIDTDIAIDYLRGDAAVAPLLHRLWQNGEAGLSVLGVYELTAGMRDREKMATKNFIDACLLIDITAGISLKAGELYRKYRKQGITLASIDCLIAATALVHGCKVATRNIRHYPEPGIIYTPATEGASK